MSSCSDVALLQVTRANTPAGWSSRRMVRRGRIIGTGKSSYLHPCLNHEKGVPENSLRHKRRCYSGVRYNGSKKQPPTAPLAAPANTEVKGFCCIAFNPTN